LEYDHERSVVWMGAAARASHVYNRYQTPTHFSRRATRSGRIGSRMKRDLPTPEDDVERRVLHDVSSSGCHVIKVMEDDSGPGFAYSVGLFHNFDHPEILIVGLDLTMMHGIINNLMDEIRNGTRFQPRRRTADILERFDCEFREVAVSYYRELLGCATWFYRGTDFPAFQCVWPDMQGHFPWEPKFNAKLRTRQPTYDSCA
jgi:hypothetical protein